MSEPKKTNLLLPLGIGAALLLLLTKKSKAADAGGDMVAADNNALPQITPDPAPQYNLPTAKAGGGGEVETEDTETEDEDGGSQQDDSGQDDADNDQDSNTSYSSSGGGDNGGGNSAGYRPGATINPNVQPTSKQGYTPASSLRLQSDQARAFTARQKAVRFNPNFIGNGKPRMGAQLPATYRPGATSASQQPIVITPNNTSAVRTATIQQKAGAIFPLKFGQRSSYIKELQKKIGVSATGYFGTQTRASLQKRFGASEVSEALYKQIITAKKIIPVTARRAPVNPVKRAKPIVRKKIVKRKR